jgi:pimeloyl-ACP methyl ester carboxylesterase
VFAYSRPGYGHSAPVTMPRPLTYMQDEARDGLGAMLDAAGISRCVLVGHSDGASIAALYAGLAGDARVAGAVLIAPHYFVEASCLEAIAATQAAYESGDLRARLARHHVDVDVAFRGWNDAWLNPRFRAWDIRDAVARIAVPVLQVQGTEDPYGTVLQTQTAEALVRAPIRTLLLPGGHAPHLAHGAAVLAAVAAFLDGLGDTTV